MASIRGVPSWTPSPTRRRRTGWTTCPLPPWTRSTSPTAQAAGTMPVLALYGIPHRDCGSFAAGGFGSADAYKGWIDGVAAAIGGGPAAIILEPDALAMADCLSGDQRQERFDLMRYAVDTLTAQPGHGRVRRRWPLALGERRGHGGQAQRGRCGQGAGLQPQHRELLHHRRGDRLRRRDFGDDRR